MLGPVTDPRTVHQAKFSMGFVLALIALHGRAGIDEFTEEALKDPALRAFHDRVEMILDPEVDDAYPRRWIGLVEVETTEGHSSISKVDIPKGDPGNPLSRTEIEDKARRLAAFQEGASTEEIGGSSSAPGTSTASRTSATFWARRVPEAAEATEAVRFEGEMVDRPVIERARGILARTSG